jgi:hypothetical protein
MDVHARSERVIKPIAEFLSDLLHFGKNGDIGIHS